MKEIVQQLDIDFDTQASRRKKILSAVKEFFNPKSIEKYQILLPNWNVLNIATFGTEGTKSAVFEPFEHMKHFVADKRFFIYNR